MAWWNPLDWFGGDDSPNYDSQYSYSEGTGYTDPDGTYVLPDFNVVAYDSSNFDYNSQNNYGTNYHYGTDYNYGSDYFDTWSLIGIPYSDFDTESFFDQTQDTFDYLGLAPGFGEAFDLANAGISLARGRPGAAALSATAAIPFVGWGATGAKWGGKALRGGDKLVTVYRGVRPSHPGFKNATKGIAKPQRPITGHTNAFEHNRFNTKSKFTSWTTNRNIAKRFSGSDGIILEQSVPSNIIISSPDKFLEHEILLKGTIKNSKITNP